jgi:spore cortex formation protein SpoVR/YcgB (stage V sporulation)
MMTMTTIERSHDWTNFRQTFLPLFQFWDEHIRGRVFRRLGGDPFPPLYRFATNDEMIETGTPYVGLPVFPGTWNNGRQFVRQMRLFRAGLENPPYEQIIQSNPVYTWMREEATMPLHCLIIAHANCGHASVFKHNRVARDHNEPAPENVLKQFAEWADELERLENDPEFGVERVEYTADAAMVIAWYNRESSHNRVPEAALRDRLEGELRVLQREAAQAAGGYQAEVLGQKIEALKTRLQRDPINPVQDIASFILDPEQNPGLSEKERRVIEIVVGSTRYFDMGIHFIHEGSSEFWNYRVLNDPQTCLPWNWKLHLATHFWNMFDKVPMNRYMRAYWLGRHIFQRQEQLHCPYEGEVEVPIPVFRKVKHPGSKRKRLQDLKAEIEARRKGESLSPMHPDKSRLMMDDEGNVLEMTGLFRTIKVPNQDLTFIHDMVKEHDDLSLFHTFLDHDTYQGIHDEQMRWLNERFLVITNNLRRAGWNREFFANPVPATLQDKLDKVMQWRKQRDMMEQNGLPAFPARQSDLEQMMEVLQFMQGYHHDRRKFRESHIARLTMPGHPKISVIDGGVDSQNNGQGNRVLILKHHYDPRTGQLRESWARESMKLLPRIWKQGGVRLETMKDEIDEDTGETRAPYKFIYEVTAKGELSERKG